MSACCEHLWVFGFADVSADALVTVVCAWCSAVAVDTPVTMNPGRDLPDLEDEFLMRNA